MSDARKAKIAKMVRAALIYAIERELDGDESLFKEVWEECGTAETKTAIAEMVRLRDMIRNNEPMP